MNSIIGLLTENNEIVNDIKTVNPEIPIIHYKSIDLVKKDGIIILLIDIDIFESIESVQFLLSKIRKKILELPVLLITNVNIIEKVNLDWYFDDFILYPFRKGELTSRIKKLIKEKGADESVIVIGNLKININEYTVYLNNSKIDLTYKEFELLKLLVQNKGTVFSRKDLLNTIWGMEYIGGTRTVDVHIRRLRGKLGDEFNSVIETVRNVGYKCKEV